MLKRRTLLAGAATVLSAPHIARAASKDVLKFIPQADLATLDPIWTTATVTRNHGFLVFDTLFGQDSTFKAQPQMAEGATVGADGKVWTIKLRPGLLFHDNTPVLARDCVASIRRWGKRDAFGQALLGATDEIAAPDDTTIQFRLKSPFALLPDALAKCTANPCFIMPERLASTDAFTQVTEMVGSGPFRFLATERNPGSLAAYAKFEGYKPRSDGTPQWTAGPKVASFARIEWHTIPDAATAAAAMQSGEMDWWEYPTPDYADMFKRDKNLVFAISDPTGTPSILRFNHLHPPFDNPAIRRAVIGGMNQDDFMLAIAGTDTKMWNTPCGIFPIGTPFASSAGMPQMKGERDYDKVKRDLAAAGYKGEKIIVMGASDLPVIKAAADVGSDMLTRCGMNVDYVVTDWGTLVQRRASKAAPDKGGWNVFFTGFGGLDFLTPAGHLPLRGNGEGAWFGWPTAPKIEELRAAWLVAPDDATQKRICEEIQVQAFIDVPYIPTGMYFQPTVRRADLSGVLDGFPMFWNVRRT